MKRSDVIPLPMYFDRYILKCEDISLSEVLDISYQEWLKVPLDKWKALGHGVYAPGKWNVKDIIQHLIDAERVFSFRAMTIARAEPNLISFDEELYGKTANASRRNLDDLVDEAITLRKSTIQLFGSFSEEILQNIGKSGEREYSVGAIGFTIAGHQRWHFSVLEEKYYPLL